MNESQKVRARKRCGRKITQEEYETYDGVPSEDIDFFYDSILKEYEKEGFVHPKSALNSDIERLIAEAEKPDREKIVLRLYDLMIVRGKTWGEAILQFNQEQDKQAIEHLTAIQSQIMKLKEKIDTLTVNFSKGKISEETYLNAVKIIEGEIAALRGETKPSKFENEQLQTPRTTSRPIIEEIRESRERYIHGFPTKLWWLVPFFFGLIGGILAYVGVRNDDEEMAGNLLIFSIIWTVILTILGWIFLFR